MPRTIAFIPVRGGSKSIPDKNIKVINGKPLVFWNCLAASLSTKIDKVIVATDSEKIAETVASFSLPKIDIYRRDPQNAQDTSSTESVMMEYIEKNSFTKQDRFILLQATSPFTKQIDLDEALKIFQQTNSDSLLSVVENKRFFWEKDQGKTVNYDYRNRPRRQDFEGYLMENGAFYISTVGNICQSGNRLNGKISYYVMPEYTGFEIDEPDDWIICEALMRKHKTNEINKEIKLLITDVDGVLTDGGMYYSESGNEQKKFNTRDGMAFKLMREAGIKTAIITTENTKIVEKRANKLKADFLYQGIWNKLDTAKEICSQLNVSLSDTAFIGDDINDSALLSEVGLAATPSDGQPPIKQIPGIMIMKKKGGEGAVREFADMILQSQGMF